MNDELRMQVQEGLAESQRPPRERHLASVGVPLTAPVRPQNSPATGVLREAAECGGEAARNRGIRG